MHGNKGSRKLGPHVVAEDRAENPTLPIPREGSGTQP